ncbi:tropomyosin-like [Varroa jacobsoni]|uniref:Uncharacterized protein n=1 Tax=Varroa destructor TaxID=109461 RepID=A0A7M7K4C9_VARDE|nr:tropomyosin-like [Varroa destructor]XP_022694111.1 tropomyosin-like [Varroa jacobsoni]
MMDFIKNVLYILTYPLWYILALMIGKKEKPSAIEGCKEDFTGNDVKLAPLDKFDPVEWERTAKGIHEHINKRAVENAEQVRAETLKTDEDEGESEEFDDDSIENLETDEELVLSDSVKKATEELQKEIEETMKLRDQLREAVEKNQRRLEDTVGEAQKPTKERSTDVQDTLPGVTKNIVVEAAQRTQKEFDRIAKVTDDAAKKVFADTQQAKHKAAAGIQGAIGEVDAAAQHVGELISKTSEETFKRVEGGAGEATNLQDELNEAIKTTQKNAKGTEETTVEFSEIFDKETRERFQALEQTIQEDVDSPLKKFTKN